MIEKLYKEPKKKPTSVQAISNNRCNRCLSDHLYVDALNQAHCMDCFAYGEINDQMMLYRYERRVPKKEHRLVLAFTLTTLQEKGAKFLVHCFEEKTTGFLQAVCGAGKTEMTYQLILKALNQGKKICFVIPRVAVLKELYKRLTKAFPNTLIHAIYEGKKTIGEAPLILSTPQQLIYFYQEFDLMILDEVDAFPYANNPFLERLVRKAIKPQGVLLYMSATLLPSLKEKHPHLRTFLIPKRYHQRPLNVPTFQRIRSKKHLLSKLSHILETHRKTNKQAILFVPTIQAGLFYQKHMKSLGFHLSFVSSKTKQKYALINAFRQGAFLFLIATTVLERGVTFPFIDCYVIDADHRVFNQASLIQIAGRVGRHSEDLDSELIFFSTYKSKDMHLAKKEIIAWNQQVVPNVL